MVLYQTTAGARIWLMAYETDKWADKWPGSVLSGKGVYAEYDAEGNLVDIDVTNLPNQHVMDVLSEELNAMMGYFIGTIQINDTV